MIHRTDELLHRFMPDIPWDQLETLLPRRSDLPYPFCLWFIFTEVFYYYSINRVIISVLLPEVVSIPLFFWVKNESLQVYFNP